MVIAVLTARREHSTRGRISLVCTLLQLGGRICLPCRIVPDAVGHDTYSQMLIFDLQHLKQRQRQTSLWKTIVTLPYLVVLRTP